MKAARVPYTQASADVVVTMNRAEAEELQAQMKAFWEGLSVGRQPPTGDSPFARIYAELSRVLQK